MLPIVDYLLTQTEKGKIVWEGKEKFTKYAHFQDEDGKFTVTITYNLLTYTSVKNVILGYTDNQNITLAFDDYYPTEEITAKLGKLWNLVKFKLAEDNTKMITKRLKASK